MKYKIQLTNKAKDDFLLLDHEVQKRITSKFRFFISSVDPLFYAKRLKNHKLGTYRFRVGDYRAIFDIDDRGNLIVLLILRIKHRREVYE